MAIINVTPDSFYDGDRYNKDQSLTKRIEMIVLEGADLIDIGGYSSRPGAKDISSQQELDRVLPAIVKARSVAASIPISVDTFRSEVAEQALNAGADMINDISGGSLDQRMFQLVAERQVPYVLMHMRGDPQNMTTKTNYRHLITDIAKYFAEKLLKLQELGVNDVIIDPGFGFAKTREQNFHLLRNLGYFKQLGTPLLAGLSRKSMIYRTLEITADEALTGTISLNTMALMNGASILRVHDVSAARQTIQLFKETYP